MGFEEQVTGASIALSLICAIKGEVWVRGQGQGGGIARARAELSGRSAWACYRVCTGDRREEADFLLFLTMKKEKKQERGSYSGTCSPSLTLLGCCTCESY